MTCGKCYQPAALEMKWLRDSSSHAYEIQVHQSSCGVVLLFASTTHPPNKWKSMELSKEHSFATPRRLHTPPNDHFGITLLLRTCG